MPPFRFTHLAPELQLQIWQQYCPDLNHQPRILDLKMLLRYFYKETLVESAPRTFTHVSPASELSYNTQLIRNVLAVHSLSRAFALGVFPDSFSIYSTENTDQLATIRFNNDRDIILLRFSVTAYPSYYLDDDSDSNAGGHKKDRVDTLRTPPPPLLGFHDQIAHIALEPFSLTNSGRVFSTMEPWFQFFSKLETLFIFLPQRPKAGDYRWCTSSKHMNRYTLEDPLNTPYPRDKSVHTLVVWPDIVRHQEYAKDGIPRHLLPSPLELGNLEELNINMWPLFIIQMYKTDVAYPQLGIYPSNPIDIPRSGNNPN